jgi:hypothetical protein
MQPVRSHRASARRARSESGAALIFALAIILALAVAGVALVRIAGNDRIRAAQLGVQDRGLACAEAGLQYGRRFFGSRYESSHGWNDYLATPTLGYRYDAAHDARPALATLPLQVRGASDGVHLDVGADLDGDGNPDFWVSIRDDDDERPLGIADNPARDNNETIILRSECTNPSYATIQGGAPVNTVLELMLTHVQGSSGYGTAARSLNAPDLVGGR